MDFERVEDHAFPRAANASMARIAARRHGAAPPILLRKAACWNAPPLRACPPWVLPGDATLLYGLFALHLLTVWGLALSNMFLGAMILAAFYFRK